MDRSLPLAALCGSLVGVGTHLFLVADWFVALGLAAVYFGAAYFYAAFDLSLFGRSLQFEERADRLGYAVGLFGLSVSPLALADHFGHGDATTAPIVVSQVGVVAFLLLASRAAHRD
ncbi:hypothetical protein [Halorussus salinus]|uniref:hypothetical protein n=1 Tax=Halorussus salinus TaxID=1364935 RepID=UPI001092B867|nr:hypothetical protein [Halorussus salinus]